MLVRPAEPEPERCTAVLVGDDRVLTASHCLSEHARHAGARCDDLWIGFPSAAGASVEWVGCASVVAADGVDDRSVLRRDVALLRLSRVMNRTVHPVDPTPPSPGSIVRIVSVRPHPIYPRYHELYERLCRVATQESAVQTFGTNAVAVGWLMDCPSHPGNSGSPILDARGFVRSVLHGASAPLHGIGISSALNEQHVR